VVPKPLAIRCKQTVAVRRLLRPHVLEHLPCRWIRLAQLVGKLRENPSIFFFVLNRQRQDFALGQILEVFQHSSSPRKLPRRKNRTTPSWKSSAGKGIAGENSDLKFRREIRAAGTDRQCPPCRSRRLCVSFDRDDFSRSAPTAKNDSQ